ncbi:MAG: hypothetical protein AB1778_05080 [Candidatus Bipolaricaulota bacterium]
MSDPVRWILQAAASLSDSADEPTCRHVLEACGRACFPAALGEKARRIWESSATTRDFVLGLRDVFPPVVLFGEEIHVVYPKCYCEFMRAVPPSEVPWTYCQCSIGWVKEFFALATGQSAVVDVISTVLRGGAECRLRVDLGRRLDQPLR